MAAKRIYQIAKEFERDEKEIIEFLTGQGIKVGNRLSAVSDETYNMLKAKFTAPPEPEPAPEPPPPPPPPAEVEKPAPETPADVQPEQAPAQGGGKRKKRRGKGGFQPYQGDPDTPFEPEKQGGTPIIQPSANIEAVNNATRDVYTEAIIAGNQFIENVRFGGLSKKAYKAASPKLTGTMDVATLLQEHRIDYPDSTPVRYWKAVNKLTTRAYKFINEFGMEHRQVLAEMRKTLNPVGKEYEPREIFTDEENKLFAEQHMFLFRAFGHGIGAINDRLYDLKMHAERMKAKYEFMDFVEFVNNPAAELRSPDRAPFMEIAEAVNHSISGIARRFIFFCKNKERIANVIAKFFEWLDGYAALKEQGAPAEKVEKYFELEKKFYMLVEFFALDNLLVAKKNKPTPFDIALDLLLQYRDNMDDPDAERNFKYKVRGLTNITFKPKEFVFLFQFGGLEPQKDYRPPEEIAAAEAAAAEATAQAEAEKENPADETADET